MSRGSHRHFFRKLKCMFHMSRMSHIYVICHICHAYHACHVGHMGLKNPKVAACHICQGYLTDIFSEKSMSRGHFFQIIKMYVTHVMCVTWVTGVQKYKPLICQTCHVCHACHRYLKPNFSEIKIHVTQRSQTFMYPVPYL